MQSDRNGEHMITKEWGQRSTNCFPKVASFPFSDNEGRQRIYTSCSYSLEPVYSTD